VRHEIHDWSKLVSPLTRILAGSGIAVILSTNGANTASSPITVTQPRTAPATAAATATATAASANAKARAVETLGALPLRFEANSGQFDSATTFAARGLGYGLSLTATGAVLSLRDTADRSSIVSLSLVGGRAASSITPLDALPGAIHHYHGNDPSAWRTGVRAYSRVRYAGVYDGIDLVYYGNQQRLEYDFEVAPGRDPNAIRLRFDGASRVTIDSATGDLLLDIGNSEPLRQHKPITYQMIDGARRDVESRYVIHPDHTVGFVIGAHDRTAPLTIDPILLYSTIFGGNSEESIFDIALDPAGNIYVTGRTQDNSGFPTTPGAFQPNKGGGVSDAFVSKFNPQGSALIYSTFLGGTGDENNRNVRGGRIAVDAAGNAFITGETNSANFPVSGNAADSTYAANIANPADSFYVKLGPTGAFVYGTYIGGTDHEFASGIAVDAAGNAYIYGTTASDAAEGFTHTAGAYDSTLNQGDVFLQKYDPNGVRTYSTLLGGTGTENSFLQAGGGLAIDDAGRAYLTGDTYALDFPIVNGFQTTFGGGSAYDVFLAVIDPSIAGAGGLIYSTYLGGNGQDLAYGIAYAGGRHVVIVGEADPNFPTKNALDASHNGGNSDAFIARFDTAATGAASLVFSTYLGGATNDVAYDVAVDQQGNIHVVGDTDSTDFPQVAPLSTIKFLTQPFIAKINAAGSALIYSTYFGAQSNGKQIGAVTTNAIGETFFAGNTNSDRANPPNADGWPMVNAFQTVYGGGDRDAVIGRITTADPSDTDTDGLPNDWETRYGLDPNDPSGANGANGDPDGDLVNNATELANGSHPRGFVITYLAEGATGTFFDTRLAIANPTNTPAKVLTRFQKTGGVVVPLFSDVGAHSRATIDVDTIAGMESEAFSTLIEADVQVVADRTMTWDGSGYGSHAERGILTRTATTWYLAEGATHGAFDLFYLLQNPGDTAANVEITYLLPEPQQPIVQTLTLERGSRTTIPVDAQPGLAETDVSASIRSTNGVPFVVERAMYFSRPGQAFAAGHESAGVTAPATRWFLAEGATGAFFNTFILIANPSADTATVEMQYLLDGGGVVTVPHNVAPRSRLTINAALEDPALLSANMSTIITSTNNVPIVVERAMWWPAGPAGWHEAHNSPGEITTGTRWGLAEGESGGPSGKQTYILIANTSAFAGNARVTLLFEDGTTSEQTFTLQANSRTNVNVEVEFPVSANRRYGAVIESLGATPMELVVERAMYSNAGGVVWAAGTNALATKLQ
jgi:Beta-propeller repeat